MEIGIVGFAGQSNMVGFRSDISAIPASDLDALIPYSTYNTEAAGAGNAAGELGVLRPMLVEDGGGNGWTGSGTVPAGFSSWGYGPEISCCRALYSEQTPIAAVKWALGGQSLDGAFNPSPAGFGYNGLKNYMTGAQTTLKNDGYRPFWKAFVWWQGEADSGDQTQADNYYYNLSRLIIHVRSIAKNPSLPFIICKTVTPAAEPYLSTVQSAQMQVTKDFAGVHLYDPSSLPFYTDNVHFHLDAHITSGNDIAEIIKSYYV